MANTHESPRQTLATEFRDQNSVPRGTLCKTQARDFVRFWTTSNGRMDDLVDCGPHFLCGAALSLRNYWPDCGFIPLINVPGSIHFWFALFGSRSSVRASACSSALGMATDGLPIWFSEITVRGVIFHFVARLRASLAQSYGSVPEI